MAASTFTTQQITDAINGAGFADITALTSALARLKLQNDLLALQLQVQKIQGAQQAASAQAQSQMQTLNAQIAAVQAALVGTV